MIGMVRVCKMAVADAQSLVIIYMLVSSGIDGSAFGEGCVHCVATSFYICSISTHIVRTLIR